MDLIKSTYEISIWQDIPATENDNEYLDEQRLATIGSNTMTSPARALSPSLRENVNGTKTLTFMMYTNYYDEDSDKMVSNPFINLLVNERKVKLREGELVDGEEEGELKEGEELVDDVRKEVKWYDFVITNIQENSENNSFTYTATDLHINELAKNGFNLEFDNELENNQGTVNYLAEKILEGTDWTVGEGDKICQYKYEPVYEWTLSEENTYTFIKLEKKENEDGDLTQSEGGYIYVFYSSKEDNEPYCIFNKDFSQINTTETLTYEKYPTYQLKNTENIITNTNVEPFQVERLIDSIKSGYDVKIDKYYNVYTKGNTKYHCYSETDFISPETVQELIVGGDDFTSTAGWTTQVDSKLTFEGVILPEVDNKNIGAEVDFDSYLRVVFPTGTDTQDTEKVLFNEGIYINSDIIGGFNVGDTYYVDLSGYWDANQENFFNSGTINVHIYETDDSKTEIWDGYEKEENDDTPRVEAFRKQTNSDGVITNKKVWRYTFKFTKPLSLKDLKTKKYKIGFTCGSEKEYTRYFDFISFFKEVKTKDGDLIYPEDVLGIDDSYAITKYYIYNPTLTYESLDDLTYEYVGEEIPNDYAPVSNNFEKIRSISAKESNRYNLIQTLAETFQCWARFEIEHDENTGKIKLDNTNKKPIKKVSFHNYVNDNYNYAGFKKGINLSSTTRDIASDQIVSKLIVKNNANEFATDGFCSIARSKENYTQENYLYNFDYYISHGLIDGGELFADLYNTDGYYTKLRSINLEEEPLIQKMSEVATVIINLESQLQTSQLAYEAAESEKTLERNKLKTYCGLDYEDIIDGTQQVPDARWSDETFIDIITQIKICDQTYNLNHEQYLKVQAKLDGFNDEYDGLKTQLEGYAEQKEELNKKFFSKYSRFIKEGTWISEDYYDDDLYYLDSEKVLFESAYPKVSYTIQVMDLSKIEEFENYKFELGQKSFIEDTDFFGWYLKNGILTPRQEEIIVSEIIRYFEEPERNIITVQNYKARFDELFQRITATTQSLQYHSGEYGRAANVVETSGEIKYDTLQNSIANNALIIKNAKDQSVVIGDNGITVTNLSRPNEIVRIVSGGVLLSNDGGQSYGSAIRGSGINANYITAGQINAERVNIMMGNYPSFKWDSRGINAFYWYTNEAGITEFNTNQFVRFDRFGLYGCNLSEGVEFTPENLEKVKEKALFGLTWDGFFLKSDSSDNGRIEITSKQDIRVITEYKEVENPILDELINYYELNEEKKYVQTTDTSIQENKTYYIKDTVHRIEIGLLEKNNYGIRFKNNLDETTLETDTEGNLWLKNKLSIAVDNNENDVSIGTLNIVDEEHGRGVINATNNFIVYEDGYVEALGGEFSGTINAENGNIGGLSIKDKGLSIFYDKYTEAENPDFSSSDYYELTENGEYIETEDESPVEGKIYYIKTLEENPVLQLSENQLIVTGEINTQGGSIGGFIINENEILSTNRDIELHADGKIIAKNIELGTGALIQDYLKIGNAYIYNPDNYNNLFIKSGDIQIFDDGTANFGKISVDGNKSIISGENWSITNDLASFENAIIQGTIESSEIKSSEINAAQINAAQITTSIFEYDSTQVGGGSMIFKNAASIKTSKIDSDENGEQIVNITIDKKIGLTEKSFVLINTNKTIHKGKIISGVNNISESENDSSLLNFTIKLIDTNLNNEEELYSVIHLMDYDETIENENERITNNFLIGINSEKSSNNLLLSKGITLSELSYGKSNDNTIGINSKTKVFIGDLKSLDSSYEGYGLYGENVYLTGSLTTEVKENAYAGINTLNDAKKDESSIVFWAGAKNKEEIAKAPFIVTENGSIYASKGEFTDSLISRSRIESAEIYTAKIYGSSFNDEGELEDGSGELSIYDGAIGIVFKNRETDDEIFKIDSQGLSRNDEYFIEIGDKIKASFTEIEKDGLFIRFNNTEKIEMSDTKIAKSLFLDEHVNIQANSEDKTLEFYIS